MTIYGAIRRFEKKNGIKISDYKDEPGHITDNYISGKELYGRMKKWLSPFSLRGEKKALLAAFSKTSYYPEDKYRKAIGGLLKEIVELEGSINDVFVITFASERASGGDFIRSEVRMAAYKLGLKKGQIIALSDKLSSGRIDEIMHGKAIVFFDDFLGSGKTMYGNCKRFVSKCILGRDVRVYICSIAARENQVSEKRKKDYEALFKREITFMYNITTEKSAVGLLKNIEKKHIGEIEERLEKARTDKEKYMFPERTYCMGFEHNEQLIAFYYGPPNNTIMSMWFPVPGTFPVFASDKYERPSIDKIKGNKQRNINNAYKKGAVQHNGRND